MADQWATRIELEAKEWDDVIFLTLTYDDEHIPYGEIIKGYRSIQSQTVSKRDVQLFLKRLRKAYKKPIKYFLAAEYGDIHLNIGKKLLIKKTTLPCNSVRTKATGCTMVQKPKGQQLF